MSVYGQYIGIAMINLMNQLYVRSLLALSVAGVLGLAAVGYLTSPPPDQPLLVTAPTPSASQGTNQPAEIRVEISGGVSQPGVISLPEGSRLIDEQRLSRFSISNTQERSVICYTRALRLSVVHA